MSETNTPIYISTRYNQSWLIGNLRNLKAFFRFGMKKRFDPWNFIG